MACGWWDNLINLIQRFIESLLFSTQLLGLSQCGYAVIGKNAAMRPIYGMHPSHHANMPERSLTWPKSLMQLAFQPQAQPRRPEIYDDVSRTYSNRRTNRCAFQ